MKPRATTMQQRMGFADPDLTTPKHDEMVLWLVENKVDVSRLIGMKVDSAPKFLRRSLSKYAVLGEAAARQCFEIEKDEHASRIEARVEVPVKSRDYVIGFVDVKLELWRWMLVLHLDGDAFWDDDAVDSVYIEVKPSIPSFGELTRQINHYREYLSGAKFYVCSPDTRFRSVLEGQGIGFIEYPETRTPTL